MSDLKPCPFCGSDKILFIVEGNFKPWENEGLRLWYRCHCYNCGIDGGDTSRESMKEAAKAWNRRAHE